VTTECDLPSSSVKERALLQQSSQEADNILDEILQDLSEEFEELAYQTKAIQRARKIETVRQLLRMVFLYCGLDYSSRVTASIMTLLYQPISDTAIFERLKLCKPSIEAMIRSCLEVASRRVR
jgi:hypothetical protein